MLSDIAFVSTFSPIHWMCKDTVKRQPTPPPSSEAHMRHRGAQTFRVLCPKETMTPCSLERSRKWERNFPLYRTPPKQGLIYKIILFCRDIHSIAVNILHSKQQSKTMGSKIYFQAQNIQSELEAKGVVGCEHAIDSDITALTLSVCDNC